MLSSVGQEAGLNSHKNFHYRSFENICSGFTFEYSQ